MHYSCEISYLKTKIKKQSSLLIGSEKKNFFITKNIDEYLCKLNFQYGKFLQN